MYAALHVEFHIGQTLPTLKPIFEVMFVKALELCKIHVDISLDLIVGKELKCSICWG
jgi:hypothetical protein